MDKISAEIAKLKKEVEPTLKEIEKLENELEVLIDEAEKNELAKNSDTVKLFNDNGAEYIFVDFEADDNRFSVGEDDGTLHVRIGKLRGCFICNQDLTKSEWKKEAREILKQLNIPFNKLDISYL